MGYDGDFYDAYERYLYEPGVREMHDRVLYMWSAVTRPHASYVVDLGCGRSREFLRFGPGVMHYQGFDVGAREDRHSTVADYRDPGFVETVRALDWEPDAFVSLFSTECTAPWHENKALYDRLFAEVPTLRHGLVAGFYYAGRKDWKRVTEAGGVVSWQTVEPVERMRSATYDEVRVELEVPSEMFGDDVVEVWRMLRRR